MMEAHSFGYWLRLRRKAHDLTREALAQRVGCSAATIQKLEEEERRPSAQVAERLAEIFNIPENERTSFIRFARGNWRSAPSETHEDLPWHASTKSPRSNLPTSLTSMIGRENEIADIRQYLLRADIRLVTLSGPPGIGKTRLSIEAARESLYGFPDGVFFVTLAPLDDLSLIAPAVVQALGYREAKNETASQQLVNGIGDKQMLIVLDNCEHLIEIVASFVSGLLLACSHLKMLTTSRESLRIPGEWLYSVPAFEVPDASSSVDIETAEKFPALTLFAERARAVRSDFVLNADNTRAVAAICTQIDGLPLAIELIAARVRLMSPQALLEHLNDQFTLYADGMRAQPARQKTLHDAIAWSYNLLSEEEKQLFVRLAVFSGGFTVEAALAIFSQTAKDKPMTNLITLLWDKSLLQRTFDANGEPRFSMLATIRQFALNSLRRIGEEANARNWHLGYFHSLAEEADKQVHGPDQTKWIDRVEIEHDNFRTALEWSVSNHKAEPALRLLCALGWPWEIRGHYREGRSWLDKIRAMPDVGNYPALYARLLNHIGRHSWSQLNYHEARALLEESQAISLQLGTDGELLLAETLIWLGLVVHFSVRDSNAAKSLFQRGLELYEKRKDQWWVALSTFHLGIAEIELHNYAGARSLLEKSLALFRQMGDLFFIARVSVFLGYLFMNQGDYGQAHFFIEEHLRIDKELQFWNGIVVGWRDLGNLYRHQVKYDQASQCYEEYLIVCREHDLNKNDSFYVSGLLALYLDNYTLTFQRFTYLIEQVWKSGEKSNIGVLLIGLAAVAGGTNQPERAARLSGAAQALLETKLPGYSNFDWVGFDIDWAEFDRHIQIAREQLGEAKFESLAVQGRAMTTEQAIIYALGNSST